MEAVLLKEWSKPREDLELDDLKVKFSKDKSCVSPVSDYFH